MIPPCGVCGGPRRVTPDGHRWCPECQKARARARRERLRAAGLDARAPMPGTPQRWAERLEAEPGLFRRVCLEARDGSVLPEEVEDFRPVARERRAFRLSLPEGRRWAS